MGSVATNTVDSNLQHCLHVHCNIPRRMWNRPSRLTFGVSFRIGGMSVYTLDELSGLQLSPT